MAWVQSSHHVVAGGVVRFRFALVELTHRVGDGTPFQALLAHLDQDRCTAPLVTHLGDHAVFLRQPALVEVADAGEPDVGKRGQRRVVDVVRHAAGTDHPDSYQVAFLLRHRVDTSRTRGLNRRRRPAFSPS